MVQVFLTGATGYIGGQILHVLLSSYDYDVTVLVRTQEKAEDLLQKTKNRVKIALGDLNSADVLTSNVQLADLVISAADAGHLASVRTIAQAMAAKTTKTIYIHTSGTSVLGDGLGQSKPAPKVYSDIADIDAINALPESQPHRVVDKYVLEIQDQNPLSTVVQVSPSTIFGKSDGYGHQYSAQIPLLVKLSIQNKKAFTVYEGADVWSHVHIRDLGELYGLLIGKLVGGESIPSGKAGFYFGSYTQQFSAEIDHLWGDVLRKVGQLLKERGALDSADVEALTPEQIAQFSGKAVAPHYFGTNSISRADNGVSIGWKPVHHTIGEFWDSILLDVDYVLSQQ